MKPGTLIISSLTPLRGIAALLVAVFHFNNMVVNFTQRTHSMFVVKCYMMVDLFFIMSGFIIMHVYKESFAFVITPKAFKKFILARFARIYPLHFFTLLLAVALFYLIPGSKNNPINNPAAIPTNLLLLHSFNIHKIFTWNIPSWSISAEWWAYLVFPMLCLFLFQKRKLATIVMILVIILSYISIMYLLPRHDPFNPAAIVPHNLDVTYDYGFLRGLAGFMTGMLMYLLYQNNFIKKIFGSDILCVLCIFLLIATMHFGLSDITFIPVFSILILCLACNNSVVSKVFNNRVLQFLGNISYSIYLNHAIIIFFMPVLFISFVFIKGGNVGLMAGIGYHGPRILSFFKGLSFCLLYLFVLTAISALTYYKIEKPCRNWINRKWAKKPIAPLSLAVP